MNLPQPRPLPSRSKPIPFVIVADDAFPMKDHIMKPYSARMMDMPERVFNYRLSRARRVVENAFGICAARFRILRKAMELHPERVVKVTLAVCALHNFLIMRQSCYASPADFDRDNEGILTTGSWRNEVGDDEQLMPLRNAGHLGRGALSSHAIRDEFKDYFLREGNVEWQYRAITGQ